MEDYTRSFTNDIPEIAEREIQINKDSIIAILKDPTIIAIGFCAIRDDGTIATASVSTTTQTALMLAALAESNSMFVIAGKMRET